MSTQIDLGLRLFLMDGASAGLGSFAGTLMHMGLAAQNAGNSFSQLSPWVRGAGLVAAGAGLAFGMFVGAIQYSTDAAKELETAVTTVVQNVDGAKDHIDEIRQVIINLGSASIYSSQQVADGFAALGQKGITASDIIHTSIGQSMIWLAEAMGQDGTTGAANLLGSTLQVFGAKASEASQYADMLAYAFHHGIPSVEQLQQAINGVGAQAVQLKIPASELLPVLDVLGQRFGSGSQAGLALKNMLLSIINPTVQAANELNNLGIISISQTAPALKKLEAELDASGKAGEKAVDGFDGSATGLKKLFQAAKDAGIKNLGNDWYQWALQVGILSNKFFDAKGNFIGLDNALKLLNDKVRQNTHNSEQAGRALGQIFNRTALKGADALLNNFEQTRQKLIELNKGFQDHGTAQQLAAEKEKTLAGREQQFSTTLKDSAAIIGGPVSNVLAGLLEKINGLLGGFNKASPAVHTFFTKFLLIGTAISGVTLVVSLLILIFAGPFAGIALIVLGVVAGILLLSSVIAGFKNIMSATDGPLLLVKDGLIAIGAVILATLLPTIISLGAQFVVQTALWVAQMAVRTAVTVAGFVAQAAAAWAAGIAMVVPFLPFILLGAAIIALIVGIVLVIQHWGQIAHWLQGVWSGISGWFYGNVIQPIIGFFNGLIGQMGAIGGNIIHALVGGLLGGLGAIGNAMGQIGAKIMSFLPHSPADAGPLSNIDKPMPNMMKMFASGIRSNTHLVHSAMTEVGNTITPHLNPRLALTPSSSFSRLNDLHLSNQTQRAQNITLVTHNHMKIGSREVTHTVIEDISSQLRMNGLGRTL